MGSVQCRECGHDLSVFGERTVEYPARNRTHVDLLKPRYTLDSSKVDRKVICRHCKAKYYVKDDGLVVPYEEAMARYIVFWIGVGLFAGTEGLRHQYCMGIDEALEEVKDKVDKGFREVRLAKLIDLTIKVEIDE